MKNILYIYILCVPPPSLNSCDVGRNLHNGTHTFPSFRRLLPILCIAQYYDPPQHNQIKKWDALLVYMDSRVGRSFEYPLVGRVEGENLL